MIKFSWRSGSGLDTGIVFQIRHYWEIWKAVNEHSFILICQMATLVGRAFAEVYTVPELLVKNVLQIIRSQTDQRATHGLRSLHHDAEEFDRSRAKVARPSILQFTRHGVQHGT